MSHVLQSLVPRDAFNCRLLAVFLMLWAVSCWDVPYPKYFAMRHVPTVFAVIGLVAAERKVGVSHLTFTLIVAFLLLHLIGARYLYSNVPYDDWCETIFGFRIGECLGFERNHCDRLVHFCFGLLFVYPLWEMFSRALSVRGWWPGVLAIRAIMAASAVYEIAEWGTAITFAPDWAEAYNGQLGDSWNAQKDMVLAGIGSVVGATIVGPSQKQR